MFEIASIVGMFIVFVILIGKGMSKLGSIFRSSRYHMYRDEDIEEEARRTYEILRKEREKTLKWIEETKKKAGVW